MATIKSNADLYQQVTNRILEQMEQGIIPWQKPWHGGLDRAISYSTGKPYSLINQLLLGREGEYLTFKQVKDLGGSVRRGAKAQMVVFFKRLAIKETIKNEEGEGEESTKIIPLLRYYNVFHIEDCEGIKSKIKDEPATHLHPNEEADEIIKSYCEREGIKLNITKSDRAFYSPAMDSVTCPLLEQFDTEAEFYSTLFHETTHSTGHSKRLDRKLEEGFFGNDHYAKEELVAELGAAFLNQYVGFKDVRAEKNNVAYLQGWSKRFKQDPRLIVSATSKAQKAVDFILGREQE